MKSEIESTTDYFQLRTHSSRMNANGTREKSRFSSKMIAYGINRIIRDDLSHGMA